jgi:hypothetical protein
MHHCIRSENYMRITDQHRCNEIIANEVSVERSQADAAVVGASRSCIGEVMDR